MKNEGWNDISEGWGGLGIGDGGTGYIEGDNGLGCSEGWMIGRGAQI